jgi:hypothetical protein
LRQVARPSLRSFAPIRGCYLARRLVEAEIDALGELLGKLRPEMRGPAGSFNEV